MRSTLLQYGLLSLLVIVISWVFGHELQTAFAWLHLPFGALIFQIIITLLFVSGWIAYAAYVLIRKYQSFMTRSPSQEEVEQRENFKQLDDLFATYRYELKKNRPWVFLLGEAQCGKTTLLANTGLSFNSITQQLGNKITPTHLIDWWIKDKVLFVDPAGRFALPKTNYQVEDNTWHYILRLTKRYHGAPLAHHVLLILDAETLLTADDEQLKELKLRFNRQAFSLSEASNSITIPASIIITKCDLLSGFKHYFESLTSDERKQPFGFSMETPKDGEPLMQKFDKQFNLLIAQINKELFWQLQHEQNLNKRNLIKDFPFQMEKISTSLQTFLAHFPWGKTLLLDSVYFTSATQAENSRAITTALSVRSSYLFSKKHSIPKSFFITRVFVKLIDIVKLGLQSSTAKAYSNWANFFLMSVAVGGMGFLWHLGYEEISRAIMLTQTNLIASTPVAQTTQPIPWLASLSNLKKSILELQKYHVEDFKWIGLTQGATLKQTIANAYQQELKQYFQPYLMSFLAKQIRDNLNKHPLALYQALKTYLMLTTPERFDAQAIQQWFNEQWHMQYPSDPSLQQQLEQHLSYIINRHSNWPRDDGLIKEAQASLRHIPPLEFAYLQLQEAYPSHLVAILPEYQKIKGIDLHKAKIPILYSQENFKKVYAEEIPKIINQLNQGNWVIGTDSGKTLDPKQKQNLIVELRGLYSRLYASQWRAVIPYISLTEPKNLSEAQNLINLLTNTKSKFHDLLRIVISNATANGEITDIDFTKEKSLAAISGFIFERDNYPLLKTQLAQLANYLKEISSAPNLLKASFEATATRFQNKGDNDPLTTLFNLQPSFPSPIEAWIKTIDQGSWRVLLKNSKNYLIAIWENIVAPDCEHLIVDHYPIYKNAKQQISIDDFTKFFGLNGTMQNFFQNYLQPFVNISGNYWTWNLLQNERLPIRQEVLEMFLRASLIQQMFFTADKNYPNLKFSLTPTFISSNANAFMLNIDGQVFVVHPGERNSQSFVWPGPNSGVASFQFSTNEKTSPSMTNNGPWAWFKLLDQINIQPTNNPRIFTLTFQSGNYTASFQLATDNLINPFLPGVMSQFRCPEDM